MTDSVKKKYVATLVGCAIGDTLGMPVEGWQPEHIMKYVGKIKKPIDPLFVKDEKGNLILEDEFGKLKYWTRDLKKGDWTDDTILTMNIAESIIEKKGLCLENIAERHLKEYKARRLPNGRVIGGFGKSTIAALKNLELGHSPMNCAQGYSPGTGCVMKISPMGLYLNAQGMRGSEAECVDFTIRLSRITHLNVQSITAAVIQMYSIDGMLRGFDKEEFLELVIGSSTRYEAKLNKQTEHDDSPLSDKLAWIIKNKDASLERAFRQLGNSGSVLESYPLAVFSFQKYWDDPINGLLDDINLGGDCDTRGAIHGAMVGARHGLIFPKTWKVADRARLEAAAASIYEMRLK